MKINPILRRVTGLVLLSISIFATPEDKWIDFVLFMAAITCFIPDIRNDVGKARKWIASRDWK